MPSFMQKILLYYYCDVPENCIFMSEATGVCYLAVCEGTWLLFPDIQTASLWKRE